MDINMYRHINREDKIPFSMDNTVKTVEELNYGTQRLLAAIVNNREKHPDYKKYDEFRINTEKLKELLINGWY